MENFYDHLQWWHWWILAVILLILEVFSPAAFFMWMGFAAGVTGLVLLVAPNISWEIQILIFAVLSVVSVLVGRQWFRSNPIETDQPILNQRGQELVGHVFEVVERPIENGEGRVRVGDTTWKVEGPDAAVGDRVRVVGVKSNTLQVEPVE